MTSGLVVPKVDGALLRLRVSPNAKTTGLQGHHGDAALKLRAAAPPGEGKADAERFVTERTGAAPLRVRVVRGPSGRNKTMFVDGVGVERVREVFRSRPR